MNPLILDNVVRIFDRHTAVDKVSLQVAHGERLALLGHNGAGKTTVMKMVLGLLTPSAGTVAVLGGAPGRAEARRSVGFLPENVAFQHAMTGWEVMTFFARLKRRPRAEAWGLLQRVGLDAAAKRRVGTYSKGMRQRLGLAQALLGAPSLLLLDEPTTGLDPHLRQAFYEIIRRLSAEGCAVVLSSHLLTELEERTDRIAIMNGGRLVALGRLDDLRAQAGLPIQFTIATAAERTAGIAERLGVPATENGRLRLQAAQADKMAVLRRLAELNGVVDVDIGAPSLDQVYSHFVGGEEEDA